MIIKQVCYNPSRLWTSCVKCHNLVTTLLQPYKVVSRLLQSRNFHMPVGYIYIYIYIYIHIVYSIYLFIYNYYMCVYIYMYLHSKIYGFCISNCMGTFVLKYCIKLISTYINSSYHYTYCNFILTVWLSTWNPCCLKIVI